MIHLSFPYHLENAYFICSYKLLAYYPPYKGYINCIHARCSNIKSIIIFIGMKIMLNAYIWRTTIIEICVTLEYYTFHTSSRLPVPFITWDIQLLGNCYSIWISSGASSSTTFSSSIAMPAALDVLAIHSFKGSSVRSNLKTPANTPPRNARGS